MDPILDQLNREQTEAVLQKDGPILIIAGAGSGKTRVLTSKIALLIREGVPPGQILALTFTNKAAKEMRDRIETLVGTDARQILMGTFHSVFVRFLREFHDAIGFPFQYTIYDVEDAQSCLKDCIGEVVFGPNWKDKEAIKNLSDLQKKERRHLEAVYKVKDVAARISRLKNAFILPRDYENDENQRVFDVRNNRPLMGRIYNLYMQRCHMAGAMDFDDILIYTLILMKENEFARQSLAERFRYVLVDEYQDTNAVQYDIVRYICSKWNNICAVGDDSQSIYAFRGAQIQNILNFRRDYPDTREFRLEANYRSTPEIVKAANRLISHNEKRLPKTCYAIRMHGEPLNVQFLRNDREEARYITQTIQERKRNGASYSDFAILYRTNAQARALEDELIKRHVPYTIYSGMSFFERMEVKDSVAYMRLTVNPSDNEAFKRICNKPARGISDATLSTMLVRSGEQKITLTQAAENIETVCPELRPAAMTAVKNFAKIMNDLRTKVSGEDAYESATAILKDTGIYALYKNEEGDDGLKRANNIDELVNSITYYIEDQKSGETDDLPDTSLAGYLTNIALLTKADHQKTDTESVSLMTSHCSKGLEFPTVFIAGVEDGLYPLIRGTFTESELEEERRLFYVSITRAKDEVIMTSCNERWRYHETETCYPSQFIKEMIPDEEEREEDMPE